MFLFGKKFLIAITPGLYEQQLKSRFEGGGRPPFLVKLVFEIAVDQQNRTSDQTFEKVPDPNRPPLHVVQPCPYLVYIYAPNLIGFGP